MYQLSNYQYKLRWISIIPKSISIWYSILFGLLFVFIGSCKPHHDYSATTSCVNLQFSVYTLFPKEKIVVKLNDEEIFSKTNEKDKEENFFEKDFCFPKTMNCKVSILSFYNSRKYIDTSFVVDNLMIGHQISISRPFPINHRAYYNKSGIRIKKWGHLSIDSCIRIVYLEPGLGLKI